ncbi:hypothetical protein GQ457_06G015490 [Hibiscus cannabinus]
MGRFLSPAKPNHGRFGSDCLVRSGRVTQDPCGCSPELGEKGFETLDSSSPDLLRPPSDRNKNEICRSPLIGQASDRWDSSENAPTVGDRTRAEGGLKRESVQGLCVPILMGVAGSLNSVAAGLKGCGQFEWRVNVGFKQLDGW